MPQSHPQTLNQAVWPTLPAEKRAGFHEAWQFKVNDPARGSALWVRFAILTTKNGFKREASLWAVSFERSKDTGEVRKLAVRQNFDISKFQAEPTPAGPVIRIGESVFSPEATRGCVVSKGKEIRWDLRMSVPSATREGAFFKVMPEGLSLSGLAQGNWVTPSEDLRFDGTVSVDQRETVWTQAPGMQGHLSQIAGCHSWAWSHCNSLVDERGQAAEAIFEGLSVRARVAGFAPTPRFSSFYFRYKGEDHRFNSIWNILQTRSQYSLNQWRFKAERGDLVFNGTLTAQYRDFAGITFEDTDGSLLYCANSKLSDLTLHVYRKGKLETTLRGPGTAAFEVVSRSLNPYVPLMI